jgi:hypothetical protein
MLAINTSYLDLADFGTIATDTARPQCRGVIWVVSIALLLSVEFEVPVIEHVRHFDAPFERRG